MRTSCYVVAERHRQDHLGNEARVPIERLDGRSVLESA